jgi:hypothetical protein
MSTTTQKRPGWVTFAAIMMFLAGGLLLVWSIEEFSNASWLKEISTGLLGQQFTIWAIIDLILGIAALAAGYSIWRGGGFGWWFGVLVAVFSAIRWFFYLPFQPWAALLVIAIDIMIIYALTANKEYFDV